MAKGDQLDSVFVHIFVIENWDISEQQTLLEGLLYPLRHNWDTLSVIFTLTCVGNW